MCFWRPEPARCCVGSCLQCLHCGALATLHRIRFCLPKLTFISCRVLRTYPVGGRKFMPMHGKREQGATRPHGWPCNEEQRSTSLSGAAGTTLTYRDRFLVRAAILLTLIVTVRSVIPAQAGIQVRCAPSASSEVAERANLDSRLRGNDVGKGSGEVKCCNFGLARWPYDFPAIPIPLNLCYNPRFLFA